MRLSIVFVFLFCACFAIQAADRYVSTTTGSDTTGDGTEGNPWATINYATRDTNLLAGETLYVMAGTYNERVSEINQTNHSGGTTGNPKTITAYGDGEVIIDGTGINIGDSVDIGLLHFSGQEYMVFENLTIQNATDGPNKTQSGIMIGGNTTFRNCTFINTGNYAVWIYSGGTNNNVVIEDCIITDTGTAMNAAFRIDNCNTYSVTGCTISGTGGVDLNGECFNGLISNNSINGPGRGIVLAGHTNLEISKNRIYGCSEAIRIDINNTNSSGVDIVNNLIYNNTASGLMFRNDSAGTGVMDNFNIINNTFYYNAVNALHYYIDDSLITNHIIRNNIFSDNGHAGSAWNYGHILVNTVPVDGSWTSEYNMFHGPRGSNYSSTNNITSEDEIASFRDPSVFDLRLNYDSTCRDSASATGAPSDDIGGNSRPWHGGHDVGAYEAVPVIDIADASPVFTSDGIAPTVTVTPATTTYAWTTLGTYEGEDADDTFVTYNGGSDSTKDVDVTSFNSGSTTYGTPFVYFLELSVSDAGTTPVKEVLRVEVYDAATQNIDATANGSATDIAIRLPTNTVDMNADIFSITAPTTYTWTVDLAGTGDVTSTVFALGDETTIDPTATLATVGVYTFTLTTDVAGLNDTIVVTVNAKPKAASTGGGCAAEASAGGSLISILLVFSVLGLAVRFRK